MLGGNSAGRTLVTPASGLPEPAIAGFTGEPMTQAVFAPSAPSLKYD